MPNRTVLGILPAQATSDGAGVRLNRTIGTPSLDVLDPFLLLDHFHSDDGADYIAGFPDHPHRGFETVTYMLAGAMLHRDNKGNEGHLGAGSVQWMTAGRGIVHSEMPQQEDGLMSGFQLWVNLPADQKMCEPRYQDIPPQDIPEVRRDDGTVIRVVAGTTDGVSGPVSGISVDPYYLDAAVPADGRAAFALPDRHTAFVYLFEGALEIEGTAVTAGNLAVLSHGTALEVSTSATPARFILVAGRPIDEPVVRYGPFVMNTKEEIIQAVNDYQSGQF